MGRNFSPSDFGDVLACISTTTAAVDKWMSQVDSAGQKGPEITLKRNLMLVRGCFMEGVCGSSSSDQVYHQWHALLHLHTLPHHYALLHYLQQHSTMVLCNGTATVFCNGILPQHSTTAFSY